MIDIILRTCSNCDIHWYSSDNSRAWICGNCGTVILPYYSHMKISNKPNWRNILLYCEKTECNEGAKNYSESKIGQTGRDKIFKRKSRA